MKGFNIVVEWMNTAKSLILLGKLKGTTVLKMPYGGGVKTFKTPPPTHCGIVVPLPLVSH